MSAGLALLAAVGMTPVHAQGIQVVVPRNVPAYGFSSVDAADYDGDGDYDLLLTGEDVLGRPRTRIARFENRVEEPIPNARPRIVAVHTELVFALRDIREGVAQWVDLDQDGRPDIALAGVAEDVDGSDMLVTELFRNENGASFRSILQAALPGVRHGDMAWGDYNGDGLPDLALAGETDTDALFHIYAQNADGSFTDSGADLPGLRLPDVEWGDYDGDGDLDLLATGLTDGDATVHLYRNDGGTFTRVDTGLPDLFLADAQWGDFDGDGDLDLALAGGTLGPRLLDATLSLWRNDGGTFSPVDDVAAVGAVGGTLDWQDYDGDGDLDLLVAGQTDITAAFGQQAFIYRNNGGTFAPLLDIRGVLFGDAVWYDYNGDGRDDLFLLGVQDGLLINTLYEL